MNHAVYIRETLIVDVISKITSLTTTSFIPSYNLLSHELAPTLQGLSPLCYLSVNNIYIWVCSGEKGPHSVWFGLNHLVTNSTLSSQNCSLEMKRQGWIWPDNSSVTYQNWAKEAPSFDGQCGILIPPDGVWNNAYCEEKKKYTCKLEISWTTGNMLETLQSYICVEIQRCRQAESFNQYLNQIVKELSLLRQNYRMMHKVIFKT